MNLIQTLRKGTGPLALIFFAACAILLWFRAPAALSTPQFWAEDAVIFYDQAAKLGAHSLTLPHVGYFHGIPRIVAYVSQGFSAVHAPALFVWTTFAFALACLVFLVRSKLEGLRWFGFAAALSFCVVSHLSNEVFWSLTNLQWVFSTMLIVLLAMDPPETRREAFLLATLALLAALTSPLSAVLLPVLAARSFIERKSPLFPALAAATLGGAIQGLSIFVNGFGMHESKLPALALAQNLELLGRRVVLQGFIPEALWTSLNAHCLALALVFVVFLTVGLFLVRGKKTIYGLLLVASALMLFATLARTDPGARNYLWDLENAGWGDRYFVPIRFSCALALLVLFFRAPRFLGLPALVLVCLMPLAGWKKFSAPALPDHHWAQYAPEIDAKHSVEIPINPGWTYKYEAPKH